MEPLTSIQPHIRVAHHYRFPSERNAAEQGRIGYCYAFHFVDGGRGAATANGQQTPIKKGDLVYFPPGMKHALFTDPSQPLSTYNVYAELWTDRPLITDVHLVWNAAEFEPALLTKKEPCTDLDSLPCVIPLQHQPSLASLFIRAVDLCGAKERYAGAAAGSLLKAFLLELASQSPSTRPIDYRIKPVIERIDKEAHFGSRYEDGMTACGLKKTQFHSLFKQATGLSPKAYWTQAIMKKAETALRESNRSVTDIAEDLGYSSIHHFTKQFTLHRGVSPTEFRKRTR